MRLKETVAATAFWFFERSRLLRVEIGQRAYVSAYEFFKRRADRAVVGYLRDELRRGLTVVDIGANVGFYTVLMAKAVGSRGKVIAIEPSAWAAGVLRSRIRKLGLTNTVLVQAALGDDEGNGTLYVGRFPQDSRVYRNAQTQREESVSMTTLDRLLQSTTPDLVKIDVQGSELDVLRGMSRTLRRGTKLVLLMELWPDGLREAGTDPQQLLRVLEAAGMEAEIINPSGERKRVTTADLWERCAARTGWYADVIFSRGNQSRQDT